MDIRYSANQKDVKRYTMGSLVSLIQSFTAEKLL